MTNVEFFTGLCQSILNPITEQEKIDIMNYEADMERDSAMYPWPPDPEPDWAHEL